LDLSIIYEYIVSKYKIIFGFSLYATLFIQIVSLQPVNKFSKTILYSKIPNKSYLHIYRIYKSNNRLLRYYTISNYKLY